MALYDEVLELSARTGWTDQTLLTLLCDFIDHEGRGQEAASVLATVAEEEFAESDDPLVCDRCDCDPCECSCCDACGEPFTYKDIDGGRCLSCGTMICET